MRPKSVKPKKQRKYQFSAGKNESHKLASSPLSPELRLKKGFRSLPLREGDTVMIMRGDHKGRSGKVNKVMPTLGRIYVDKVVKSKTDNTEVPIPIHPSNVMITKFTEKDKRRRIIINRRVKDEGEKLDLDAVIEDEEEEVIDIDDDDLELDDNEADLEGVDDDLELEDEEEEA